MAIHSSGQSIFSFPKIKGITLGVGEEVDEINGGASGMDVIRIGKVGDRSSEGEAVGVYGICFTAASLAWEGAEDRTLLLGIKVGFDKELTEVGRIRDKPQRLKTRIIGGN